SDKRQYRKNVGRNVKVKYRNEDGYHKIEGVLKDVSDEFVKIEDENKQSVSVEFNQLVETKVVPKI
ncbi:MAG: ribosome maturation factor, partial [Balneolaceae bacterium]